MTSVRCTDMLAAGEDAMPGKVIRLIDVVKRDEKYAEQMGAMVDRLEDAVIGLTEDLIGVAMAGPWAAWDAQQPVGTVADISLPALADVKDPRVRTMALVLMEMESALKVLRQTVPSGPR